MLKRDALEIIIVWSALSFGVQALALLVVHSWTRPTHFMSGAYYPYLDGIGRLSLEWGYQVYN